MTHKQIQLEIFELGHKIKRGQALNKISTESNIEPKFPMQLCVKIASVMIIAIVSFALGVERGKSISSNNLGRFITEKKDTYIHQESLLKKEIQKPIPAKDKANRESVKEKPVSRDEYIIQVATYKRDSSYIERESSRLKQKGYIPLFIPSNNYMQLCAGKFPNKKIATEHLNRLKQTYGNTCYIRKI